MNPFILALQARNLTVEIHHHAAYQIVLSNDMPFTSTIGGKKYERIHGFVIRPHVSHFCVAENGTLNVLNIEPYSTIGLQLAERFEENKDNIIFDSPTETNIFFETPRGSLDLNYVISALLAKLPSDLPERFEIDAELNEPDRATMFGGGEQGYIDQLANLLNPNQSTARLYYKGQPDFDYCWENKDHIQTL